MRGRHRLTETAARAPMSLLGRSLAADCKKSIAMSAALAEQRAVALYNTYCCGYALGMNFRADRGRGRRVMLWPEDLNEILANGVTKNGGGMS